LKNKSLTWLGWVLFLGGLLCAAGLLALAMGPASIPLAKIPALLWGKEPGIEASILREVRLPRLLLGFAVGGALSVSGVILQGMFRNPLVEPYTLGISGGAALGVCLAIVGKLNRWLGIFSLPAAGFAGAVLVIYLVYFLSVKKGMIKIQGLLLTGVMISFISSSLIMLFMAVSRVEDLHGIIFWTLGSLSETNWTLVGIALSASLLGLLASYFFCFDLNAFSLGEEEALHLGVNIERDKRILFLLASALTGLSVSFSGIIGFVGLVVPHLVRMLVGPDHRILLVASFLLGAGFLILCDTLARTIITPVELPVGVITGILGGGIFIYALARSELISGK